MKFVLALLLALTTASLMAGEQQDIVMKSRFDRDSSFAFIKKLRSFLIANNFGDPYKQTLKKPIEVDLDESMDMPENTRAWIRELQSILRLKLFESDYSMRVEELGFSITEFGTELKTAGSESNVVDYVTLNKVSGFQISARKIVFEVKLKRANSVSPIVFDIELINPKFNISPSLMMELPMGWQTTLTPDFLGLSLHTINLQQVFAKMATRPDLIDFTMDTFEIPNVVVKIGKKDIVFDQDKIMAFFVNRKEELKKGIIDLINGRMQERLTNVIKDTPREMKVPRIREINSALHAVFELQKLTGNNTGIVQLNIDGHYCPKNVTLVHDYCRNQEIETKLRRNASDVDFDSSMREINRTLIENKANIAMSVSEHFLNQVIQASVEAGLIDQAMEGKEFTLGSEKGFVLAEEKGKHLSLYMDIICHLKGAQRILVGRSELRFPIKLMISLAIVQVNGMPRFQIKVDKMAVTDQMLIEGLPQYDLDSTVGTVPRFRGKVLQSIYEQIGAFVGNTLIDLEMGDLKGTYLERMQFESNGMGRANALIHFGDHDE